MLRRVMLAFALLPWLLLGHAVPRLHAGQDRVLSAVSLADAASNPASRVDDSRDLVRSLATLRRSLEPPVPHTPVVIGPPPNASTRQAWIGGPLRDARRRVLRPKRLTVPHNANAPPCPVRQS